MPNHGTPLRFSLAKAVQEEAVLGGGVGHLGGDHRPAVEGADAGDDRGEGDELADPAAVEHGVEGGDERVRRPRRAASWGTRPITAAVTATYSRPLAAVPMTEARPTLRRGFSHPAGGDRLRTRRR